jgi:DNA-binding protein YbaB
VSTASITQRVPSGRAAAAACDVPIVVPPKRNTIVAGVVAVTVVTRATTRIRSVEAETSVFAGNEKVVENAVVVAVRGSVTIAESTMDANMRPPTVLVPVVPTARERESAVTLPENTEEVAMGNSERGGTGHEARRRYASMLA